MSSLWSKYKSLTPRTRILIGGGIIAYALVAQTISDSMEGPLGLEADETDKQKLWGWVPRIRTVERNPDGSTRTSSGST